MSMHLIRNLSLGLILTACGSAFRTIDTPSGSNLASVAVGGDDLKKTGGDYIVVKYQKLDETTKKFPDTVEVWEKGVDAASGTFSDEKFSLSAGHYKFNFFAYKNGKDGTLVAQTIDAAGSNCPATEIDLVAAKENPVAITACKSDGKLILPPPATGDASVKVTVTVVEPKTTDKQVEKTVNKPTECKNDAGFSAAQLYPACPAGTKASAMAQWGWTNDKDVCSKTETPCGPVNFKQSAGSGNQGCSCVM